MIETRIIKSLCITLHNLDEYNWEKKEYPNETNFEHYENCKEVFDVDVIVGVYREKDITYIRVLNDDFQGGSYTVPVLENKPRNLFYLQSNR